MLTERIIRDAKPEAKPRVLWDRTVKGLGCKVFPTGAKAYVLSYRAAGRKRLATIARTSEIGLKEARERAGRELAAIRAGESDPLERRREVREAPTVNDGVDRFFDEFVPERIKTGRLKERTVREYRLQASATIRPAIGNRRIADIRRNDIERMVKPLRPVQRNRVLALASRLFNLFENWEWRPQRTNPVRGVEKSREEPRDRTLTPTEFAALAEALEAEQESSPAAVAAIRLASMTGLRISEVIGMRWADIDFEAGRVTLPTTKTGRRTQALSSVSLEALAALPRINGTDHVFTTGRAGITYKTTRGAFDRAARRAGLADVRLHDLRRSLMTAAAADGVSTHVLRDLLGHKTTTMADRYIRHAGGAVAEAAERMGSRMAAMMNGSPKADVVPMGRRHG